MEHIKSLLFEKAKEAGFEDCEIYYSSSESFSVSVYKGEIEKYQNNESAGLSFRGLINNKIGYCYTENISKDNVDFIIENAKENALILDSDDVEFIYGGDESYPDVDCYNEKLDEITPTQKIEAALKMEKAVLEYGDKIRSCQKSVVSSANSKCFIANTKGLQLEQKVNYLFAYASAIAEENGQTKTNGEMWAGFEFDKFDPVDIGRKAAEKAVSELGAESIESGKMSVIFSNETASELLAAFCGSFFAENVQKGFSLLAGRTGEKIASEKVTICDDPLLKYGFASTSFDSEGIASKNKTIVENGILKTYLYNLKSAAKDGVESTGNGFRGSFKGSVSTNTTNFYIKKGNVTLNELFYELGSGLYITELMGLHSGANPVSGDFSLAASGFLIENGAKKRSVEQITVSGNFFDVLKNIRNIADDFKFEIDGKGSAALLVDNMEIAGK